MSSHVYYAAANLANKGVRARDLEGLPRTIRSVHSSAVCRMHADGVILHAGKIYEDGATRCVWRQGPRFKAVYEKLLKIEAEEEHKSCSSI